MEKREPAQAQDEQNLFGRISNRRQRIATEDRIASFFGSSVSESWLLRIGRPKNNRLGPWRRTLTPTATPQGKQRAIRTLPTPDDACLNGFLTAKGGILTPSLQGAALVRVNDSTTLRMPPLAGTPRGQQSLS
jgi:hypothetical protein